MEYYKMPPSPDARQIRVLTLYEGCEKSPPIEQISKLRADVIFVQGCSNYNRTLKFAYTVVAGKKVRKAVVFSVEPLISSK